MIVLNLGVIDLPYNYPEPEPRKVKKPSDMRKHKEPKPKIEETTGSVAEILEDKYHIMEHFVEANLDEIVKDLSESIKDSLENILAGKDKISPTASGLSKIEKSFRSFLDSKEMDKLGYPGIPTKASLAGVNHRLKLKKGPVRPSFIDTGLYQASFKAWTE